MKKSMPLLLAFLACATAGAQTLTPTPTNTPDCCVGVMSLPTQGGYNSPEGEALDLARDRLYVADQQNALIHVYTAGGIAVTTFSTGIGSQPSDAAVDPQGNLYVSEYGLNSVDKFDANLNFLATIVFGGVYAPRGIWVDSQGSIDSVYVVNQTNVYRFDGSVTTYSATATFGTGIDTASGLVKVGNWLYVADTNNARVVKFDTTLPNPQAVTVVASPGGPTAVRTDAAGYFYVSEFYSGKLYVYHPDFSTLENTCQLPGGIWGVVVNGQGQIILTQEPINAVTMIQGCVVQPTPVPTAGYHGANPPGAGDYFIYPSPVRGSQATVSYNMAEAGKVELKVWNEKAEMVAHVQDQRPAGVQITPFSIAGWGTGVYFYDLTLIYSSGRVERLAPKKFAVIH